jgi:hypothetical protein
MSKEFRDQLEDKFDLEYISNLAPNYEHLPGNRKEVISNRIPEGMSIEWYVGYLINTVATAAHLNVMGDILTHAVGHAQPRNFCNKELDQFCVLYLEWYSVCMVRLCYLISKFTLEKQEEIVRLVEEWRDTKRSNEDDPFTQETIPL